MCVIRNAALLPINHPDQFVAVGHQHGFPKAIGILGQRDRGCCKEVAEYAANMLLLFFGENSAMSLKHRHRYPADLAVNDEKQVVFGDPAGQDLSIIRESAQGADCILVDAQCKWSLVEVSACPSISSIRYRSAAFDTTSHSDSGLDYIQRF